jgi:hypothetical protein
MAVYFSRYMLIACFLLAYQSLLAQADFRTGYVIMVSGDTVYGDIDNRSELLMGQSCYFREAGKPGMVDLFPGDLLGYRISGGKYYVSRDIGGKKAFLEFLILARISMYYLRDTRGEHYYLEKDGSGLIELPYENKVIFKNKIPQAYQSKQHIGILSIYMKDAPGMEPKIAGIRKPSRKNLIRLAEDYHYMVNNNRSYTVFAGKYP